MQRIAYLDGLKGLSAIVVVLSHIGCTFSTVSILPFKTFPFLPLSDLYNGRMAVAIFVIVSAFIMAQKCKDETLYQTILLKRYFRILIPCIVPILLMVLCFYTPLGYNDELGTQLNNEWLRWWPSNLSFKSLPLSMLGAPMGEAWEWVNVMWMLKYVFLTPFVIVMLEIALKGIRIVAKAFILLLCLAVSYKYDIWFTTIFMGYIFSQIIENIKHWTIPNKKIVHWILTVGFVGLYVLTCMKAFNDRNNIIKALCIISLVMMWKPFQHILSIKPLLWLGDISFEIYLLHLEIIYIFSCRLYLWLQNVPYCLWIVTIATIVLSIVLAKVYKLTISKIDDRNITSIMSWIKK